MSDPYTASPLHALHINRVSADVLKIDEKTGIVFVIHDDTVGQRQVTLVGNN